MEARAGNINKALSAIGGNAYVSVNKGLITRSSAVIPVIAQYLGCLFKVMKEKGTHEGCIEQMERLFTQRLFTEDKKVPVDSENRIRIDDWELAADVQAKIDEYMAKITPENVTEYIDLEGIRHDFLMINGFDVPGVDYEKEVEKMNVIE